MCQGLVEARQWQSIHAELRGAQVQDTMLASIAWLGAVALGRRRDIEQQHQWQKHGH